MAAEDNMDFDRCEVELGGPIRYVNRFTPIKGLSRHGELWEDREEVQLCLLADNGASLKIMSDQMGRTQGAILGRLERLGYPVDVMARTYGKRSQVAAAPQTQPQRTQYVNFQHLIALLQKGYTTVAVQFINADTGNTNSSDRYTYKVPQALADTLNEGDLLVVPARKSFAVVKVFEIHAEPQINVKEPLALKWVVQKVDTAAYEDQTAREAEAIAKIEVAERRKAQEEALQTLLGSPEDREAFLQLISAK